MGALPCPVGSVPGGGLVCSVVGGVGGVGGVAGGAAGGVAGGVAGAVAGAGIGAVFSAAGQWVAGGAVWLLGQVGHALSASTSVDLNSDWFVGHEAVMAAMAAAVILPMVCCAAIQAVYRQSASTLLRSFLVYLPLALLFTGVAVELVRLSLAVTDALSGQILSAAGVDTKDLLAPVASFLGASATVSPVVPAFVVFIGALFVALGTLVLWLELVVRAAAVSAAVLFLPLSLAALVWPAIAHWCRRLADTLAALVLSKLVIAAVLSLAAAALAGGLGVTAPAGSGGSGSFSAVVTGIALLLIAAASPFTLLRLVPAIEAGAVSHLESARHRMQSAATAPVRDGLSLAKKVMAELPAPGAAGQAAAAASSVGTDPAIATQHQWPGDATRQPLSEGGAQDSDSGGHGGAESGGGRGGGGGGRGGGGAKGPAGGGASGPGPARALVKAGGSGGTGGTGGSGGTGGTAGPGGSPGGTGGSGGTGGTASTAGAGGGDSGR